MAVKFLTDEWAKALTEACAQDPKFTKAIKGQTAVLQVNVADSPGAESFTMRYQNSLVDVTTGPSTPPPDIVLDLDYDTMVGLSRGELNGPQAIAAGRMKAEGDMGKMMALGKAMDLLPGIEAGIGLQY